MKTTFLTLLKINALLIPICFITSCDPTRDCECCYKDISDNCVTYDLSSKGYTKKEAKSICENDFLDGYNCNLK